MKVREWPLLLVFLAGLFFPSSAQNPEAVTVRIRAALYDRDLNLKPVPRLQIGIRSLDAPDGAPKDLLVWVQHSRLEESFEAGMARSPGSNQSVMESRDTNDYYC